MTLEPDVAARVKDYAHRARSSFKVALNTLLRRGLAAQTAAAPPRRRFRIEPHSSGLRPGIDPGKLNQVADRLEAEDFVRETRAGR